MDFNVILDILKVGVGLIYLYLEYHARRELWIASVIMPVIGIMLFFNKGLYADCAINVYYLAIAIYGYAVWSGKGGKKKKTDAAPPISNVPARVLAVIAPCWLCIWGAIGWLLITFTDSTVPWLDSFTTSLSIVGMWMLARKYLQQWLVWLVVDAVYAYLYAIKGIYFSGALYCFYTVMAVLGYRKWLKMMSSGTPTTIVDDI